MTRSLTRRNSALPSLFNSSFKGLDSMLVDVDEMFRSIFNERSRAFDVFQNTSRYPKTDIKETDTGLVFSLAVPGCDEKNVEILFDKGNLTIKYDKTENKEEKDSEGTVLLNELRHSSFERGWQIPKKVKEEEISASMKNGILEVSVPYVDPPKIETKEAKKIEIKTAD